METIAYGLVGLQFSLKPHKSADSASCTLPRATPPWHLERCGLSQAVLPQQSILNHAGLVLKPQTHFAS